MEQIIAQYTEMLKDIKGQLEQFKEHSEEEWYKDLHSLAREIADQIKIYKREFC